MKSLQTTNIFVRRTKIVSGKAAQKTPMYVTLRPWQKTDLQDLVQNANDFSVARFMTNQFPHPYTEKAGRQFLALAATHHPYHLFAISAADRIVGGIGIHPQTDIFSKNAEIGYWLGAAYWGQGLATEAVRQMVAYGFRNFDILRIYGRVFENNPASARVLEKCGFKKEAHFHKTIFKNGVLLDELIYGLRRDEVENIHAPA